jgi:hypothetical protein
MAAMRRENLMAFDPFRSCGFTAFDVRGQFALARARRTTAESDDLAWIRAVLTGDVAPRGLRPGEQLLYSVFTLVLSLSLWLTTGSLILGVVDGGPHWVRSVLLGAPLVVLTTAALWRRHIVCAWLRAAGPSRPIQFHGSPRLAPKAPSRRALPAAR